MSLNVRGLNREAKRRSVFQFIRRNNVDICYLQETYSAIHCEQVWKNQWGGDIYFAHGTNHSRGCMILIKSGLDFTVKKANVDDSGRYIMLDATIQGQSVYCLNVYAPCIESEQLRFYHTVQSLLKNNVVDDQCLLIGGDMNIIVNPTLDRKGGNMNMTHVYKNVINVFTDILEAHTLCDIWRVKYPNVKKFTWKQKTPCIKSRLDMWLMSNYLQDYCKDIDIVPYIRSDHSAVILRLESHATAKGKGLWKLNNSLLKEEEYVNGITSKLNEWIDEAEPLNDVRLTWEYVKYKVRDFSILYGKLKQHKVKSEEALLEKRLKALDELLDESEGDCVSELTHERETLLEKLRDIDTYRTEGLIIRSRCRWYEEGEKSNAYFLRLLSRNKTKTTMNKLITDGGEVITNQSEILKKQAEYYERLYSDKSVLSDEEIYDYLRDVKIQSLSDTQRLMCNGSLSYDECEQSLLHMKKGKSPGNDGLSVEFYQTFWKHIGELMVDSINKSYEMGQLTASQCQAVIVLLDKGKDRTLLKNWRPISLLNVDYKIASKAVAERLKKMLPDIVNQDQVGYVTGRNITDNIRTVLDILEYTDYENISGILINIDFEKAFDSVGWRFIEIVLLEKYKFDMSFVKWIQTFYNGASSCVYNNGFTSPYFKLQRGVRQGDPLSPYIFILVAEILASKIRQDKEIQGISLGSRTVNVLQYADDTNGLVANVKSGKRFLQVVETFGLYSGLKLNKDKTEGMWLGKSKNSQSTPLGIRWPKEPIRILGVYVSYDKGKCDEINFESKVSKCNSVLNEWKGRNLTLIGRVQIVKTFIISMFLYVTSTIVMPHRYMKQIDNMVRYFVWRGGKSKVSKSILQNNKCNGGLELPSMESMICVSNIKWILRYLQDPPFYWKLFCDHFFKSCNFDLKTLLCSHYNVAFLKSCKNIPHFYVNVVSDWITYVDRPVPRANYLWYNQNILVQGLPVFYKDLNEKGVCYIRDMYDEENKIIPFHSLITRGLKKCEWLRWHGLVNSIKHLGQGTDSGNSEKNAQFCVDEKDIYKCTSKELYKYVMVKRHGNSIHIPKIAKYIGDKNVDWSTVYMRPFKYIMDSRTAEFQYKFLHDILVNQYWLYKWNLTGSSICRLCKETDENIYHMFWECRHVISFWNSFDNLFQSNMGSSLTCDSVFLGTESSLFCTVIFNAKRYLHKCFTECKLPELISFVRKLQYISEIEKHIFSKRNKTCMWYEKWNAIIDII